MARCNVCHRAMSNPAHIAMGMGPVCAAKVAAKAAMRDLAEARAGYPLDRYQRIERGLVIAADWFRQAENYRAWARRRGTAEEQAEGEWQYRLTLHWLLRATRMRNRARKLLAPARAA
ncbi:MAG: DUF6011 domain-containing protein [Ktedonobacterales bacterium]